MTHNQVNFQNYYQNISEQYGEYYDEENQELDVNYNEVPPDLQVPSSRLHTEGYPDVTELYARKAQLLEPQQPIDNINFQYRQEYTPGPTDFYYNVAQPQLHHRTRVPKTQLTSSQGTPNYQYPRHQSFYTSCPLATQNTIQRPGFSQGESHYVPKVGVKAFQGTDQKTYKGLGINASTDMEESYNMEEYHEHHGTYGDYDEIQRKVYQNQENYERYCAVARQVYGENQGVYVDYKGKRFSYGNKVEKSGGIRKYPVTVKTPKYVAKNQVAAQLNKRPSALCLPVITQPDPGLVRRKSKTHNCIEELKRCLNATGCTSNQSQNSELHIKTAYDKSEQSFQNADEQTDTYSYSAHQMHSEGDMNQQSMVKGLEHLLDHIESKVVLNDDQDIGDGGEVGSGESKEDKIKEFSKFLKPRVPSSVRARQENFSKIKSSIHMQENSFQPKMKLSLDKLLNRLQKCEKSESGEKLSEKSYDSGNDSEERISKEIHNNKHRSFNYDTLTSKLSQTVQDHEETQQDKPLLNKPSTSLTTSLDNKKSSRLIRPMDDHCALDLHRSKSYIVDLIDRALSRELGTVPRGQSLHHDMTPKRAVTTISRHRQSCHKELCYEVTAALTDSFISNATAPQKQNVNKDLTRSRSNDDNAHNKLCTSFSDDADYIKQLKQLKWGHIRHIQYEARKLADLEEFLEQCGEVEY